MRTGILADATAEGRFNPMSQEMHDQLLAKAHFQKHGLTMKRRRDDRYRAPQRPRAPYMALAEYAQILNPLNPQPFVESHGLLLEAAKSHQPQRSFSSVVEQFNASHPSYSTEMGMNPVTAFFIQQLDNFGYKVIDVEKKFTSQPNQYGSRPSKTKNAAEFSQCCRGGVRGQ